MKRREFIKAAALAGVSLLAIGGGYKLLRPTPAAVDKQKQATTAKGVSDIMATNSKILIAYFSWSGNTKAVAEEIQRLTGGDLVEITPSTPYSTTYAVCVAKAKVEQLSNARPAISTKLDSFEQYDTVLLGYPNWWGSLPMPIATFLDTYKMSGKRLALFMTHGGGGIQRCYSDLAQHAAGAKLDKNYLCLSGSNARSAQREIKNWVAKVI